MNASMMKVALLALLVGSFALAGCGDDADTLGVGGACTSNDQCDSGDDDIKLSCLTAFKGGYCGIEGCTANKDCPENSVCVTHEDNKNYCFRVCGQKADCNANRGVDIESNCSSSAILVEAGDQKVCLPPSDK